MFERYTERSRRAIFFAHYEASRYGSSYIKTEHLLLGLLREDGALAKWFPSASNVESKIRAEIDTGTPLSEQVPKSVEVPLSAECKRVLLLAADTSDRLGHDRVEPEHLLIAILRVETSLAAHIMIALGLKQEPILKRLAKAPNPKIQNEGAASTIPTLENFLSGLKSPKSEELISFFAKNAQFIDASGKRWNRDEISKEFEALFAPYGKKNASYSVEATLPITRELLVANVLWKNALLASELRAWVHVMSIVFVFEANNWVIVLAQVTPVDHPASGEASGLDTD